MGPAPRRSPVLPVRGALAGKGNDWVKSAAAASDIDKQITDTRELIKLCK